MEIYESKMMANTHRRPGEDLNLYGFLIILISLPLLMLGCVKTDLLVMKPCEKKEEMAPEEKIVMLLGEGNQSQSVTVTEIKYPGEEASVKGPCQVRVNQTCILGLGCFEDELRVKAFLKN